MEKQIVITGIGSISSLGLGNEELWEGLKSDRHGLEVIENSEEYTFGKQYIGKCPPFKLKEYFKLKAPFPNYYSQLGLLTTYLAIQDSGLDLESVDPYDVGCIMNTNYGSNTSVEKYLLKLFEKGAARVSPLTFTETTTNHIVGTIARYFNLKGPNTISMGEESFSLAADSIRNGQAKMMFCGGLDHIRDFHVYALNEKKESHHPISDNVDDLFTLEGQKDTRGKTVVGEAACFLLLEEKEHALARGAKIYAEVLNTTCLTDMEISKNTYLPDAKMLEKLYEIGSQRSGVKLDEVDLFVGSSALPEAMNTYELEALKALNTKGEYTSILSRIGECMGGSSAISLAATAMALKDKYVPGCGYSKEFFNGSGEKVCSESHPAEKLETAVVNSIHMGGSVSCTFLRSV